MKLLTDKRITKIIDALSTITALKIVILIIVSWLIFGSITKIDPYPFLFSSTVTNYSGFILTIIILIATKTEEKLQKELDKKEKKPPAQLDGLPEMEQRLRDQINTAQEKQNKMIIKIAQKLDVDI